MRKDRRGAAGGAPRYGAARAAFNALAALCALCACGSAVAAAAEAPRIAILGDSIAAGYGLAAEDAFPARLEAALRALGVAAEVSNAGVSGDTTAGGLARVDWLLADSPGAVVVALGGNDALRGLAPEAVEANLAAIVEKLRAGGARVMLAGMLAPRNLGEAYAREFDAVFPRVARRYGAAFYPFLLDGVAADPALNQPDGIHPNAAGAALIAERMAPVVAEWLAAARP